MLQELPSYQTLEIPTWALSHVDFGQAGGVEHRLGSAPWAFGWVIRWLMRFSFVVIWISGGRRKDRLSIPIARRGLQTRPPNAGCWAAKLPLQPDSRPESAPTGASDTRRTRHACGVPSGNATSTGIP